MFSEIRVAGFKLFDVQTAFTGLKAINILSGVNGRGKSSFLQTMLTMAQSVKSDNHLAQLKLNGEYVQLGNAMDVRSENIRRESNISFTFQTPQMALEYEFGSDEDKAQVLELKGSSASDEQSVQNFKGIHYVSAERVGPQMHYSVSDNPSDHGVKGQFVASALYANKDKRLEGDFIDGIINVWPETRAEEIDPSVGGVTNFMLTKLFGPTQVQVRYEDSANVYVMHFQTLDKNNYFKTTNVGFGYSYVLPILVSGLTAEPNDVLIVENPEAHLHPMAQSIIGKFLALVTRRGVQVFIESHSEHVVNALRVMIKQASLLKTDVNIMYFGKNGARFYQPIDVQDNGQIVEWPEGFLDQAEKDLDTILGI